MLRVLCIFLLCFTVSLAEPLTLSNDRWSVVVDPETLAVQAFPKGGQSFTISAPVHDNARPDQVQQHQSGVKWRTNQGREWTFQLEGKRLLVTVRSQSIGSLTWPVLTGESHAYLLPFFEGSYVPSDDPYWTKFLTERGPIETTSGLSMPFWGVERDQATITYIVVNPFNNQLSFKNHQGRLGLRLRHEFTSNWKEKSFALEVHLGERSPVTPSHCYRQFLKERGEFKSLVTKIEETPEVEKLLGAAHVYLWDATTVSAHDVVDWLQLARELQTAGLGEEIPEAVLAQGRAYPYQKRQLVEILEDLVGQPGFTSRALRPRADWGDGFSTKLVNRLAEAGLDRLWLGLDDWRAAERHPAALERALEVGYLVAPYDSYHSIHEPGAPDSWPTAQFDQHLYETGPIVGPDGRKSPGFKGKGYHLSPLAAQPYVEARVEGIQGSLSVPFNSWFLDCDAYGELFDDFSPRHRLGGSGPAPRQEIAFLPGKLLAPRSPLPLCEASSPQANLSPLLLRPPLSTSTLPTGLSRFPGHHSSLGVGQLELGARPETPLTMGSGQSDDPQVVLERPAIHRRLCGGTCFRRSK